MDRSRGAWAASVLARTPRGVRDGVFEASLRAAVLSGVRVLTPSARFALNELFLRRGVRRYTVRRTGRTLFLRHPVTDAWAVFEVLNQRVYLPPPPIGRALDRVAAPRIVDLGAHIGAATLLLLERFPAARVLAVEPHPETAALLRRMIAVNGLDGQCEVRQAAAGVAAGRATMEGSSVLAHLVRSGSEEAVDQLPALRKFQVDGGPVDVEMVDALPMLAGADLVKMDIEGAEWPLLQDPRFRSLRITALVLEYHSQGAPRADLTPTVRALLRDAGFSDDQVVEEDFNRGVIWAWRA